MAIATHGTLDPSTLLLVDQMLVFAAPSPYHSISLTVSPALMVLAKCGSARGGILGDEGTRDVPFSRKLSIVWDNCTQFCVTVRMPTLPAITNSCSDESTVW